MLRPFRIASPRSSAQGPWGPSDLRVPYLSRALCGTQRLLRPFRLASVLCSTRSPWGPSDLRVPYLPLAFYGAQRLLRPLRFASFLCSTQTPQRQAEKQVDFIETLQKCKCFMFHAEPARSSRKQGGFYSDPSEMQVFYVPRRAPEIHQK